VAELADRTTVASAGLVLAAADVLDRAALSGAAAAAVDEAAAVVRDDPTLCAEVLAGLGEAAGVVQAHRAADAAVTAAFLIDAGAGAVDAGTVLAALSDAGSAAAIRSTTVLPRAVRQAAGAVDALDLGDRAGPVTESTAAIGIPAGRPVAVGLATGAGFADLSFAAATRITGLELTEALPVDAGLQLGAETAERVEAAPRVQISALPRGICAGKGVAVTADTIHAGLLIRAADPVALEMDAHADPVHASLVVTGALAEGADPPATIVVAAGLPHAVGRAADAIGARHPAGAKTVTEAPTAIVVAAGHARAVRGAADAGHTHLTGGRTW